MSLRTARLSGGYNFGAGALVKSSGRREKAITGWPVKCIRGSIEQAAKSSTVSSREARWATFNVWAKPKLA